MREREGHRREREREGERRERETAPSTTQPSAHAAFKQLDKQLVEMLPTL
jgi:hypothetical protein